MRRGTLTPAQRRVWEAFRDLEDKGVPPSFQEVADHLGFSSLATVHEHVENLAAKGWLRRGGYNRNRNVVAVTEEQCPHCGGEL